MSGLLVLLIIIYVLVCLFLILVVLLQQGKGADLAGAFGGGGTQTSFGPRSSTNVMHRLTTWSFVVFVVLSLALAVLTGKTRSSVIEDAPPPAAAGTEGMTPGESSTTEGTTAQAGPETATDSAGDAPGAPAIEPSAGESPDGEGATPPTEQPANPPAEAGSQG